MTARGLLRGLVPLCLALGACGTKVSEIRLAPEWPGPLPRHAGAVALGPFADARGAGWTGPKVGELYPAGGQRRAWYHVIERPAAEAVREWVGEVLRRAGYTVVDAAGPAPALGGRLLEFRTEPERTPLIARLECHIALDLSLEAAGGRTVAKSIRVEHFRHATNLNPDRFERVANEGAAKLLQDVAAFVASPEFEAALRPAR